MLTSTLPSALLGHNQEIGEVGFRKVSKYSYDDRRDSQRNGQGQRQRELRDRQIKINSIQNLIGEINKEMDRDRAKER